MYDEELGLKRVTDLKLSECTHRTVLRFEATITITPVEFGTSLKTNAIPTNLNSYSKMLRSESSTFIALEFFRSWGRLFIARLYRERLFGSTHLYQKVAPPALLI